MNTIGKLLQFALLIKGEVSIGLKLLDGLRTLQTRELANAGTTKTALFKNPRNNEPGWCEQILYITCIFEYMFTWLQDVKESQIAYKDAHVQILKNVFGTRFILHPLLVWFTQISSWRSLNAPVSPVIARVLCLCSI